MNAFQVQCQSIRSLVAVLSTVGFPFPFLQECHCYSGVEEWSVVVVVLFVCFLSVDWHVDFLAQKEKVFSPGKSVPSKVIQE